MGRADNRPGQDDRLLWNVSGKFGAKRPLMLIKSFERLAFS